MPNAKKKPIVSLDQIFTANELHTALMLYVKCESAIAFHKLCTEQIIRPALARINRITGQENDANYWAYVMEYAIRQMQKGK